MKILPSSCLNLILMFGLSGLCSWGSTEEASSPPTEASVPTLGISIPGLESPDTPKVEASINSSIQSYSKGKPFYLALNISFPKPWHGYWLNPGTVGIPMSAKLESASGFSISPAYWSTPSKSTSDLGTFYGYEHAIVLWKVTAMENAPENASFQANASWQICKDGQCLPPEDKKLTLELPQGDAAANPQWQQEENKVSGLEIPDWAEGGLISADLTEDKKAIILIANLAEGQVFPENPEAYFFSLDNIIQPTAEQKWDSPAPGEFRMTLILNDGQDSLYPLADDTDPTSIPAKLIGVLKLGHSGFNLNINLGAPPILLADPAINSSETTPQASSTPQPRPVAVVPTASPSDIQDVESALSFAENFATSQWGFNEIIPKLQSLEFLRLLGLLFLGGLILNLMPCVFPVIGLKVLSFVQMGGDSRARVFAHAGSFVIGVIISFWIVTLLLIGLKISASGEVNWAFWMENVWVIYLLLLLMLAMGLSMYGVFEIGVKATGAGSALTQKKGFMGSFWSGVLATVIATPCSAPFLGGVMAPAMALPFSLMFLAFTAMGIGMAFPYVILGLVPSLVKYLPRPGGWMESFKQGLSFLLFGTAAWLLWVLLSFYDDSNLLLNALIGFVLFACGLWIYGRWCPIYRAKLVRLIGFCVAFVCIAGGIYLSLPPKQTVTAPTTEASVVLAPAGTWMDWSPAAMKKALAEGHPVYVDYTARWCLTCQVNKKAGYNAEVMELFRRGNVILMRADKTKPNAEIDAELVRLKRAAVPVNVLYREGLPPLITSEILTPSYLINFLKQHLFDSEE